MKNKPVSRLRSWSPGNEATHRTLTPKLIWPTFNYSQTGRIGYNRFQEDDSDSFPGEIAVYQNQRFFQEASASNYIPGCPYGYSLGIREFWEAFSQSSDVVLVDSHFSRENYHRLIHELDKLLSARDARSIHIAIFGRNTFRQVREYDKEIQRVKPQIHQMFSIEIHKLSDKTPIHDRFAIMDGEIWHCGAAVGGMHGALSAVSRGWPDKDGALKKFFMRSGS